MSLLELPAELLHRICDFLSTKDVTQLRRVSRSMKAFGDEHFLQVVNAHFIREDFKMIEDLVESPVIANSVKRLHFQADRLQRLSFKKWDAYRKSAVWEHHCETEHEHPGYQEPHALDSKESDRALRLQLRNHEKPVHQELTKYSKKQLQAIYVKYCELHLDQINLLEDRPQTCFRKVFEKCPKLDSVCVTMREEFAEHPWRSVKQFRDVLVGPYCDDTSSRTGYRPVTEVLRAAAAAGKRLKKLQIDPISYQFFKYFQHQYVGTHMWGVIEDVQELHVGINDRGLRLDREESAQEYDELENLPEDEVDAWLESRRETNVEAYMRVIDAFEDRRLVRFLSRMADIRVLSVMAPRKPNFVVEMLPLSDIVGNMTWKNLTSLYLQNFVCKDNELVWLLRRHQNTLEALELDNVTFTSGSIKTCFSTVAGKLPILRSVSLRGQWSTLDTEVWDDELRLSSARSHYDLTPNPFTAAVERYLIEGGEFPDWRNFACGIDVYAPREDNEWDEESDFSEDVW